MKTETLNLKLQPHVKEMLRKMAKEDGFSMTVWISQAVMKENIKRERKRK